QVRRPLDFIPLAIEQARDQIDTAALPIPEPRLLAKIETYQDLGFAQPSRKPEDVVLGPLRPILAVSQAGLLAPRFDEFMVQMQQRADITSRLDIARAVFAERQP